MSFANTFAFIIGISPLLILVGVTKFIKPKGNALWIYGTIFILFAAFFLDYLSSDLPLLLNKLFELGALTEDELASNKGTLSIWVYLAPAIIAAIGANFITEYLVHHQHKE